MREMKIHVLDVGHGDTIILEMPIGEKDYAYGLIDCVKFEDVTGPYLKELKVEKLEFVCGTHPHDDHVGGIKKVLEAYEGKVGEYWDSGKEHTLPEYLELAEYLDKKAMQTEFVRSGNMVRFGKTRLHILSPPTKLFLDCETESHNINNASIVILVEYGQSRIILSGDAQFASWAHIRVTHRDFLKAQALKVSHHGSVHGNFLECLEVIDPKYAIISAGTRDLTKFPHKNTIDALHEIGMDSGKIFITRDVGDIVITSTGSRQLKIATEKNP
jgi:competence protein ComEC